MRIDRRPTKLMISGVPDTLRTKADLLRRFVKYGPLTSVELDEGSGTAYVTYTDRRSAEAAFGGAKADLNVEWVWGDAQPAGQGEEAQQ